MVQVEEVRNRRVCLLVEPEKNRRRQQIGAFILAQDEVHLHRHLLVPSPEPITERTLKKRTWSLVKGSCLGSITG